MPGGYCPERKGIDPRVLKAGRVMGTVAAGLTVVYGCYRLWVIAQIEGLAKRSAEYGVYAEKKKPPWDKDPIRGDWPNSYVDTVPTPQPSVVGPDKEHVLYLWIKLKREANSQKILSTMARLPDYVRIIQGGLDVGEEEEVLAGVGFGPELYKAGAGGSRKPLSHDTHYLIRQKQPSSGTSVGGDIFLHAKSNDFQKLCDLSQIVMNNLPRQIIQWADEVYTSEPMEGLRYRWEGKYPLGIVNHILRRGDLPKFLARSTRNPEKTLAERLQAAVDPTNGGSYVITQKWVHNPEMLDSASTEDINNVIISTVDECVDKFRRLPGETDEDIKKMRFVVRDLEDMILAECDNMNITHPKLGLKCEEIPKEVDPAPLRMLRQSMPFCNEQQTGFFFMGYTPNPLVSELLLLRIASTQCDPNSVDPCPEPRTHTREWCAGHKEEVHECVIPKCTDVHHWASNERTAVWYFPGVDELAGLL